MKVSRLFGGTRLRSRSVTKLVVLAAAVAVAGLAAGSASASFPAPPSGHNGWYTQLPVSGSVSYTIPGSIGDHFGPVVPGSVDTRLSSVTCTKTGGAVVGTNNDGPFDRNDPPVTVNVSVNSDSPSSFGTQVFCSGQISVNTWHEYTVCAFVCFQVCCEATGYQQDGTTQSVALALLKIDSSPPTNVTVHAASAPNANGWYKTAGIAVTFNGFDLNSGIIFCDSGSPFGAGGPHQTIGGPDGVGKVIEGGCQNFALLNTTLELPYNFDGTAPSISASATPPPNSNGWYNGNVDVSFTCFDALSGIASCPANEILSSEGAGVASTAQTATDQAGNESNPSNIVEVNIDKTAPTITVPANKTVNATSPAGANVNYSADVSASDALSGIGSSGCLPASGSVFPIGQTTVTCNATDKAGNSATPKSFTVQVNGAAAQLSVLLAAVTNVAPGSSMADKLRQIQGYVVVNDKASACSGLTNFISLVKAQSGKKLTAAQATSFIAQATNIRATLGCS